MFFALFCTCKRPPHIEIPPSQSKVTPPWLVDLKAGIHLRRAVVAARYATIVQRKDSVGAELQISISVLPVCSLRWSSLAYTVEHAAHLAAVTSLEAGAAYLVASILLGWGVYLLAHRWGRRW